MNRKLVYLSSLVLILAFGFLYVNSGSLTASDFTKKKCCNDQSTSANTKKEIKAGGDQYSTYEFSTDKACCNEMRSSLQKELLGASGVKDVKFSETCSASKMTVVTIFYNSGETSETQIASLVKDKSSDCPEMPGCDKKGCSKEKSGTKEKSGNNSGTCPHNGDCKNKKTNGKDI